MNREEIIRNLEYTMEKHKNDTVGTFDTNISLMCKDILDYLEQEPCDDAISRELMFNRVDRRLSYTGEEIQRIVKNLPPVTTECVCLAKVKEREDVLDKIRAELIQSIQNGTLKIESGNEELFRIIDKYKVESESNGEKRSNLSVS